MLRGKESVLRVLEGLWRVDLQEEAWQAVFSLSNVQRMNRTAGTASVVAVE